MNAVFHIKKVNTQLLIITIHLFDVFSGAAVAVILSALQSLSVPELKATICRDGGLKHCRGDDGVMPR